MNTRFACIFVLVLTHIQKVDSRRTVARSSRHALNRGSDDGGTLDGATSLVQFTENSTSTEKVTGVGVVLEVGAACSTVFAHVFDYTSPKSTEVNFGHIAEGAKVETKLPNKEVKCDGSYCYIPVRLRQFHNTKKAGQIMQQCVYVDKSKVHMGKFMYTVKDTDADNYARIVVQLSMDKAYVRKVCWEAKGEEVSAVIEKLAPEGKSDLAALPPQVLEALLSNPTPDQKHLQTLVEAIERISKPFHAVTSKGWFGSKQHAEGWFYDPEYLAFHICHEVDLVSEAKASQTDTALVLKQWCKLFTRDAEGLHWYQNPKDALGRGVKDPCISPPKKWLLTPVCAVIHKLQNDRNQEKRDVISVTATASAPRSAFDSQGFVSALRGWLPENYWLTSLLLAKRLGDKNPFKWKKVVVVGGGPMGLLSSILYAKLGAEVTVVEKRRYNSRQQILNFYEPTINLLKALGADKLDEWEYIGLLHEKPATPAGPPPGSRIPTNRVQQLLLRLVEIHGALAEAEGVGKIDMHFDSEFLAYCPPSAISKIKGELKGDVAADRKRWAVKVSAREAPPFDERSKMGWSNFVAQRSKPEYQEYIKGHCESNDDGYMWYEYDLLVDATSVQGQVREQSRLASETLLTNPSARKDDRSSSLYVESSDPDVSGSYQVSGWFNEKFEYTKRTANGFGVGKEMTWIAKEGDKVIQIYWDNPKGTWVLADTTIPKKPEILFLAENKDKAWDYSLSPPLSRSEWLQQSEIEDVDDYDDIDWADRQLDKVEEQEEISFQLDRAKITSLGSPTSLNDVIVHSAGSFNGIYKLQPAKKGFPIGSIYKRSGAGKHEHFLARKCFDENRRGTYCEWFFEAGGRGKTFISEKVTGIPSWYPPEDCLIWKSNDRRAQGVHPCVLSVKKIIKDMQKPRIFAKTFTMTDATDTHSRVNGVYQHQDDGLYRNVASGMSLVRTEYNSLYRWEIRDDNGIVYFLTLEGSLAVNDQPPLHKFGFHSARKVQARQRDTHIGAPIAYVGTVKGLWQEDLGPIFWDSSQWPYQWNPQGIVAMLKPVKSAAKHGTNPFGDADGNLGWQVRLEWPDKTTTNDEKEYYVSQGVFCHDWDLLTERRGGNDEEWLDKLAAKLEVKRSDMMIGALNDALPGVTVFPIGLGVASNIVQVQYDGQQEMGLVMAGDSGIAPYFPGAKSLNKGVERFMKFIFQALASAYNDDVFHQPQSCQQNYGKSCSTLKNGVSFGPIFKTIGERLAEDVQSSYEEYNGDMVTHTHHCNRGFPLKPGYHVDASGHVSRDKSV